MDRSDHLNHAGTVCVFTLNDEFSRTNSVGFSSQYQFPQDQACIEDDNLSGATAGGASIGSLIRGTKGHLSSILDSVTQNNTHVRKKKGKVREKNQKKGRCGKHGNGWSAGKCVASILEMMQSGTAVV
ncbi:unnamed protein product [Thelazia callipaeda]|uniref:CACTA en-spm transposon protein n=1 Tax=Thelazia callipaeda TaxID=103827 RepID=A0A0N5CNS9_THECL|nr:unnamed protein product [Thelazia callipaeda]